MSEIKKVFQRACNNDFLIGFCSLLDVSGEAYITSIKYYEPDFDKKALERDWLTVGKDIESAMIKFNNNHPTLFNNHHPAFYHGSTRTRRKREFAK